MSFSKISTAIAVALALSATPVLASSQSVRASSSALSAKSVSAAKANARSGTALRHANAADDDRGATPIIIGIGALALVGGAVAIAVSGDDDPKSP